MRTPLRGEVWLANFEPAEGHEQGGTRPAVILSANEFNESKSRLVVVVPCTTRDRGNPLHVRILPPDGGLAEARLALTEMVHSISQSRLIKSLGRLSERSINEISGKVKLLLELD
jgi:mRNA interferase MazF